MVCMIRMAFFVDNPINCNNISDITPGLKNNTDGSLDIYLLRILNQQNSKTGFLLQMGPFSLLLRMYVPQDIVIKGQYQLPAVEKVVTNK
ncbi:MAG: DUF1214 domain-containing protein [Candidatus Nitrosopolaris sp.]